MNAGGQNELAASFTRDANEKKQFPFVIEDLEIAERGINHVNVPIRIHCHALVPVEVADILPHLAE
jgi:hypothetical protein